MSVLLYIQWASWSRLSPTSLYIIYLFICGWMILLHFFFRYLINNDSIIKKKKIRTQVLYLKSPFKLLTDSIVPYLHLWCSYTIQLYNLVVWCGIQYNTPTGQQQLIILVNRSIAYAIHIIFHMKIIFRCLSYANWVFVIIHVLHRI